MSVDAKHDPVRLPWLSVALVSAAALAYEILLLRLLSIIQWHHFASMVVSLALLGYGASGTLLGLARARLLVRFRWVFPGALLAFPATALPCFLLAQRLPVTPDALLWQGGQAALLMLLYLLLAMPFACAGLAVGLALVRHADKAGRLYAADLLGAGAGSVGVLLLMMAVPPAQGLVAIAMAGLLAAAAGWREAGASRGSTLLLCVAALVPLALPPDWIALRASPYKDLPQTLRVQGARLATHSSGPLGEISLVANPVVPFRIAPGLSLLAAEPIPRQWALFIDGDAVGAVTDLAGGRASLAYLDQTTAALPFHLRQIDHAVILNAGGADGVLRAWFHGVPRIEAVELNPRLPELLRRGLDGAVLDAYALPGVRLSIGASRGALGRAPAGYDLVQLDLPNAPGAAAQGLLDIKPTYDLTVEALALYLSRLDRHGLLAINGWTHLPARDLLRLLAAVSEALAQSPGAEPLRQVVMVRGWQTATLVVGRSAFAEAQIDALRAFCRRRGFDLVYYPGMAQAEANRFNRLPRPIYYLGARELLGGESAGLRSDYRYDLEPARDDRPFFFDAFSPTLLAQAWRSRDRGGLALVTPGFPMLLATLLQALLAGLLLILAPLLLLRRRGGRDRVAGSGRALTYFLLLGLGFMLLEIGFLHRFVLFLHHPVYAATTVLASFLVFAGIGSALAQAGATGGRFPLDTRPAIALVLLAGLAGLLAMPALGQWLVGEASWVRYLVAVLVLAPLALAMGMPFPLGLMALQRHSPALLPWAWAANGCASVVGAVLATVLAIRWGLTAVTALALVCYAAAGWVWPAGQLSTGPQAGVGTASEAGVSGGL